MYARLLLSMAALAAQVPVSAAYFNYTFGNEEYTRMGWVPITGVNYTYAYLNWHNLFDLDTAYDSGETQPGTTTDANCSGLCASSFPWGLSFNVSQPARTVFVNATSNPGALDLYSLTYGCFAIGPNGTDTKGHKTYGRVPRDCTVTLSSKTKQGKQLSQSFQFKPKKNPTTMVYGQLPSSWRNLTTVYWNATSTPSKDFPYPVSVGFDDLSYGIQNVDG